MAKVIEIPQVIYDKNYKGYETFNQRLASWSRKQTGSAFAGLIIEITPKAKYMICTMKPLELFHIPHTDKVSRVILNPLKVAGVKALIEGKEWTPNTTVKKTQISIDLKTTAHKMDKVNLVTISSRQGMYDKLRCKVCGIEGKRYGLSPYVTVVGAYNILLENSCKHPDFTATEVIITHCTAVGTRFSNLTPGSIHKVLTDKHSDKGVWVMGVGEPVVLLRSEFKTNE